MNILRSIFVTWLFLLECKPHEDTHPGLLCPLWSGAWNPGDPMKHLLHARGSSKWLRGEKRAGVLQVGRTRRLLCSHFYPVVFTWFLSLCDNSSSCKSLFRLSLRSWFKLKWFLMYWCSYNHEYGNESNCYYF